MHEFRVGISFVEVPIESKFNKGKESSKTVKSKNKVKLI